MVRCIGQEITRVEMGLRAQPRGLLFYDEEQVPGAKESKHVRNSIASPRRWSVRTPERDTVARSSTTFAHRNNDGSDRAVHRR